MSCVKRFARIVRMLRFSLLSKKLFFVPFRISQRLLKRLPGVGSFQRWLGSTCYPRSAAVKRTAQRDFVSGHSQETSGPISKADRCRSQCGCGLAPFQIVLCLLPAKWIFLFPLLKSFPFLFS
jgi:hypothetical protein